MCLCVCVIPSSEPRGMPARQCCPFSTSLPRRSVVSLFAPQTLLATYFSSSPEHEACDEQTCFLVEPLPDNRCSTGLRRLVRPSGLALLCAHTHTHILTLSRSLAAGLHSLGLSLLRLLSQDVCNWLWEPFLFIGPHLFSSTDKALGHPSCI